jgi:hypothetical protein
VSARTHPQRRATPIPTSRPPSAETTQSGPRSFRVALAAALLLGLHYALAAVSLLRENPTVDEVLHLPAGVSYWQQGTFKLYRHNPPLVKLVAALPVVAAAPETGPIYQLKGAWLAEYPSQATFGQVFLALNFKSYFELFAAARLVQPLWSVLGGLVVFAWARRLYGDTGGLFSLALWCLCPNILAHARLVTSDAGAAAIGCLATYLFWRYLHQPTWRRALFAGVGLGLAQLTKFSLLILYGLWPLLWLIFEVGRGWSGRLRRLGRGLLDGLAIVALSILTIDAGYLFEGVGRPLGSFDFASRSPLLTRPGQTARWRTNPSGNPLIDVSWRHRVNRFRGTPLAMLPAPLPRHYLLGFDEQKIEADGIPRDWIDPVAAPDELTGYPVYLDGTLRRKGWWYYYIKTLQYKMPEGTLALAGLALVVTIASRRARAPWPDELTLVVMPLSVLGAMSFLTDINLGLRYVLPMFPYMFIFCGKLAPWALGMGRSDHVSPSATGAAGFLPRGGGGHETDASVQLAATGDQSSGMALRRPLALALVAVPLLATALATATIHPHYLAYFNWANGGAARGSEHLIDSNLDWGQDLVGLREWLRAHPEAEPIGLAYFGQLPPGIFAMRGDGFPWVLPPALLGRLQRFGSPGPRAGPLPRLRPGVYAVSATLLRGLPWRLHDPTPPGRDPAAWLWPSWDAREHAFGYFNELTPFASIGHSILLYRVNEADATRLNARHWPAAGGP